MTWLEHDSVVCALVREPRSAGTNSVIDTKFCLFTLVCEIKQEAEIIKNT